MQCPLVDSIWASFPSLPDNINGELLSCSDPLSKLSSAVLAAPTITQAVGAKQMRHLDLSCSLCRAAPPSPEYGGAAEGIDNSPRLHCGTRALAAELRT